jgi:hypothetical protein
MTDDPDLAELVRATISKHVTAPGRIEFVPYGKNEGTEMTDVPKVRLAGRDWEIPLLAIKQLRVAIPAIFKIMPVFARVSVIQKEEDKDPFWFSKVALSTEDFDAIADATYAALTRATPGLARTEFDNLPISIEELLNALPVIVRQTGMIKPAPVEGAPAGEGLPAVSAQTSTSSSDIIAPQAENSGLTPSKAS